MSPDKTFRTSGDEFTSIVQARGSLYDLRQTAARVAEALSAPVYSDWHTVIPRATIGGAVLSPQDLQPDAVRRNAEFALYHAKETMRGGFVRYWPGIGTRMTHRRDAIREVTDALEDNRIDAHYQPVLNLDTHEIVGFEALSRMTSVNGRMLRASLFQEAFSDAHVAAELTDRMLQIVADDMRDWLQMGLPLKHVGVNVTSADFYRGNLAGKLHDTLSARGLPQGHLIIEVTEDVYIGQRDCVVAAGIADLRAHGVRVALDDFGTGFAALAHLLTVPVDIIKIDQSFIRRLAPCDPSAAIVNGILQIARDLGIKVVAEGIETVVQLELLTSMGCALGQGYAYSKAVDRDQVVRLMSNHAEGTPGSRPLLPVSGGGQDAKPLKRSPTIRRMKH
jgi:EAL domain-containing protein (putative c-di-GMP-specific phosphodiesterase class I)